MLSPDDDGIVVLEDGISEQRSRYGTDAYLQGEESARPQELVWGCVRDAPSPTPSHQNAVLDLAVALQGYVREWQLGIVLVSPMDCVLDRERNLIVQPDLLFVSKSRMSIVTDRVWGAPDFVLEVLSPKPRIGTLSERLDWFARYGVRETWLYHQLERRLDVLRYANGSLAQRERFEFGERIVSAVFPRFDRSCAQILSNWC